MRKILLTLVLTAIPFLIWSQDYSYNYFFFGYQKAEVYLGNVNRQIYVYNFTRPWLSQKMDFITDMQGGFIGYGFKNNKFGSDLYFSRIANKNTANGIEASTGTMGERTIRAANNTMGWGGYYYLINKYKLSIGLGISIDGAFFTTATTYRNKELGESAYKITSMDPMLGHSFSLPVHLFLTQWLGVYLQPYYQFFYSKAKVEGIADELQGATYPYSMDDKANNYGIKASIVFATRK